MSRFLPLALTAALAGVPPIQAQSWQAAGSLPTGGAARTHCRAVQVGAAVYILGGTPFPSASEGAVHVLYPSNGGFGTPQFPLEEALLWVGIAVDNRNRIIVFGGQGAGNVTGDDYEWTVTDGNNGGIAGRSSQAPDARFSVATNDANLVYSLGGGPGAAASTAQPNSARVERYDGVGNAWTVRAPMPSGRADAGACYDGQGHVLVAGGFDAVGVPTTQVLQYDEATDTWSDSSVPPLPVPLTGLALVLGADQRVYAIGGHDGTATQATSFVLDAAHTGWATGPVMAHARQHFGALLVSDDYIWVFGGEDDGGGTSSAERLFTPVCPEIVVQPTALAAFPDTSAGFVVRAVGAPPLVYQWRRNGVPLADGPTGSGSTVSGAHTEQLGVTRVGTGDLGSYDCVVSNGCGPTSSAAVALGLRAVPRPTGPFVAESRHPQGALSSYARAIDGTDIGGYGIFPHAVYNQISRPLRWPTVGGPAEDLTPPNSVGGAVLAVAGPVLAGWYWWPFTTSQGTAYYKQACIWNGGIAGHANIQLQGWDIGWINATDGQHHTGTLLQDETSFYSVAYYWPTVTRFPTPLTSAAGNATAMDGDRQFGNSGQRAQMWHRSVGTNFDLHPAGATTSYVLGARDGQQVGSIANGGVTQATLWTGSNASAVSLHPTGAASSIARAARAGYQVGSVGAPLRHAALWRGDAATVVDLHAYLAPDFTSSDAYGIDVAADGTIIVVGEGNNSTTGRVEALVWRGRVADFWQDADRVSLTTGGSVPMHLDASAAHAGATYIVLGSLSGSVPGTLITPSLRVPLNFDLYTSFFLQVPNALIVPSVGVLDGNGRADTTFVLPALPGNGPLLATHAYVLLSPALVPDYASHPLALTLDP
ncbi:MAG: immunoglobulin domain-containing protein [Planctomycetota bacterium]